MSDLAITVEQGIGTVRFDRSAKRNALTGDMMVRLGAAIPAVMDQGARVVLVTGGPDMFTAGADLSEFTNSEADLEVEERLAAAADALAAAPVPTIAAIEGPCLGAGVELALACDVRVAGRGAFFMIPATKFGILYRPEGVTRIERALGYQTAARLFLLNERLHAEDAWAADVVGVLTDTGEAYRVAHGLAVHAASLHSGSVEATKRLMREIHTGEPSGEDWDEVRRNLARGPRNA